MGITIYLGGFKAGWPQKLVQLAFQLSNSFVKQSRCNIKMSKIDPSVLIKTHVVGTRCLKLYVSECFIFLHQLCLCQVSSDRYRYYQVLVFVNVS